MTHCLENRTFDELTVGDTARTTRTLSQRDFELLAVLVGGPPDLHPLDKFFATDDMLHQIMIPNLWINVLLSWVVGTQLPGSGSIYQGQRLHIHKLIAIGDTLTVRVTVADKSAYDASITLDCEGFDEHGDSVFSGTLWVMAPTVKVCSPPAELPIIHFAEQGARHKYLVTLTTELEPVPTAVVHPTDPVALEGAIRAAKAGLIHPFLIGPAAKIQRAAAQAELSIQDYEIVDVPYSQAAAVKAVEWVRTGRVELLVKGSLHTDELMAEVVKRDGGLRTERRISHVFVMDIPTYHKLLLITDSAINIEPDLLDKRDIVQNAIDLAHIIGVSQPKVAILSAVETVTPKLKATMEAAALCKMAERGQITGALLDGPLAFDNAISKQAAHTKGITSAVAGDPDILLMPDLEAGNMVYKQLAYLANATGAGIVVGAKVPIVLTSRADGQLTRLASCALGVLMVRRRPKGGSPSPNPPIRDAYAP